MSNPYVDLCLAVQGIRREFERVRTPVAAATGVAASIYTHQVANTYRVLTDLRVRHLLADEVGLGKTVQALMILNALRTEQPDLRALVVVPDRLAQQWRDEVLTRAHTAPAEGETAEEAQYIRLAWENQLRAKDTDGEPRWSLSDIDPAKYDVLVVDELPRLRADLQDRLVRVAPDFGHVLILTATPAFQRPKRHAQLFAILEPERTANARWQVTRADMGQGEPLSAGDDLSKWPEWAAREVVDSMLRGDQVAADSVSDDDDAREAAALAHCAYRRVLRTRRQDYAGVLPRRQHVPTVVEPLAVEEERQALMWRYFKHLGKLTREFDSVLLAKRVILSPPSLQQRVDFLLRKGHDREGLVDRAKPLVHRSRGDSRADALVDILARVWTENRDERVVVAAQDNLTVDYLFQLILARLPMIGPHGDRRRLKAALLRQGQVEEMLEDLGGYGNEMAINLDAFQRGEAQILFAPEKAQVGLNLQRARVLVLYSVPWKPEEVEQWIGRLDRIGNPAAYAVDGEARSIDVYTIAQRGLVDERVVAVLQRFHVFERSVNLDGDHLGDVADLIERAALRPGGVNWHDLENKTEEMAVEDEVQEMASALRPWLPWTVGWAKALRRQVEALPPAGPVLVELPPQRSTGPWSWDRAMEGMLKLLGRSREYNIRWNNDPEGGRFKTLWYQFGEFGPYGHREILSRVHFSFGANPAVSRSPANAFAFITRRGDIETPPRRNVLLTVDGNQERRSLHFFGFGDRLHDELVRGWAELAPGFCTLDVGLFSDHEFFSHGEPGLYLVRISSLDAGTVLMHADSDEWANALLAAEAERTPYDRRVNLLKGHARKLRCALRADMRWLRAQLPGDLRVEAFRLTEARWTTLGPDALRTLLNPMAHDRPGRPVAARTGLSAVELELLEEKLTEVRAADTAAWQQAWSHRLPAFERARALRLHVVSEEASDDEQLAARELEEAERRLEHAQTQGNAAQVSRAQSLRHASADLLAVTRCLWAARTAWLRATGEAVRVLSPEERVAAVVRVKRVP